MKIVGYARVSTTHQQLDSQIYALESFGCDIIFKEYESGRLNNRSQLSQALESLSPGDTFVIFKLDRLSRGTKHLLSLMEFFNENQINFISIQNNIDTSTSIGKFFFTIMSAFAEMEADLIRERVISGLQAAKENGVTLGRPVKNKNIEQVINQYLYTDKSITQIAIDNDISRPTVYRYLKTRNVSLRPTKEKQDTRIK
ncbi:recombinase family protein [Enterococcus faecalis]|uniref:recombinase family protein n=1 Tax=Enterococcus faecalis TaxID=1351 RepID=UPI0020914FE6|nr:recombinase family protein [Enterococcus faecalis]MCO5422310.1 recombinase family protein [Enterococcus faecalis]